MANHNIYLPDKYEQLIREKLKEGESVGQCAKRLLMASLDEELTARTNEINSNYVKRLTLVESKLEVLTSLVAKQGLEKEFGTNLL